MERYLFHQLKSISVFIFLNLGIGEKFKELHSMVDELVCCASTSPVKSGWKKCHRDCQRGPDLLSLRVLLRLLEKPAFCLKSSLYSNFLLHIRVLQLLNNSSFSY